VRQFTRLVSETPAGRQVAAAVMRDGQRVSVNVTPRESNAFRVFDDGAWSSFENLRDYARTIPPVPARPTPPRPPSTPRAPRPPVLERFFTSTNQLGVTVSELSDQLAEYFGTKAGVLVTSVSPDSAAMKAGVKAGDVIVSVNGSSVERSGDVRERMRRLDAGEEFTLDIVRDKKSMTLKGKAEAPATRRRTTRTIL
jgi:S1-C subfamily serine protease